MRAPAGPREIRVLGAAGLAVGPSLEVVGAEERFYVTSVVPRDVWEHATGYQSWVEQEWWLKAAKNRLCVTQPPTIEVLTGPNDTGYFGGDSVRVVIEGWGRRVL